MFYFSLSLIICSIIFFIGYLVFSLLNYKAKTKEDYNFKNMFMYELNIDNNFKNNIFGNICLILSLFCGAVSLCFVERLSTNGYLILSVVGGIIAFIATGVMANLPLLYLKGHILSSTFSFIFTFANSIGILLYNAFWLYEAPVAYDKSSAIYIIHVICLILSIISSLAVFFLFMNPKLTSWGKLEEVRNTDGTKGYVRPKWFVLAFSEWMNTFVLYFNLLLIILVNLVLVI